MLIEALFFLYFGTMKKHLNQLTSSLNGKDWLDWLNWLINMNTVYNKYHQHLRSFFIGLAIAF